MAKASTSKKTKTSKKRTRSAGTSAKTSGKKSKKKVASARRTGAKASAGRKKTSKSASSRRASTSARSGKTSAGKAKAKTKSPAGKGKAGTAARGSGSKRKADSAAPARKAREKQADPAAKTAKTPTAAAAKSSAHTRAAEAVRKSAGGRGSAAAVAPPPVSERVTVEEALASLPYTEGQFVVHPKYGLGRVDRLTERKLSTRTVPCLEISFSYQEMRLTIPVDQVERSGIRRPIGKKSIDDVFKVLRGRATFDAKRRSAKRVVDYRKRLGQGDPNSLAEAVRDLARLSLRKSLSYEERKILSTALRILSREVALARGREPDDVREEIEKIVYR